MLPQTMWLNKAVEEQLQTLKGKTGVTPNVAARIAFFRSVEKGFVFDKHTWLGKTQQVTELLLKQRYPEYSDKELQTAWAAHVEDGVSAIRNHKALLPMVNDL